MTFQITILSGNLIHDTQLLGQMISTSKQLYRTKVVTGAKPQWNQIFQCSDQESQLLIQVFDKERFKRDDLIGEGILNLKKMLTKPYTVVTEFVQLIYNNKPAGTLLANMYYEDGLRYVGNSLNKSFNVSSTLTKNTGIIGSGVGSGLEPKNNELDKQIHFIENTTQAKNRTFGQIDLFSRKVSFPLPESSIQSQLNSNKSNLNQSNLSNQFKSKVQHKSGNSIFFGNLTAHPRNIFSCLDGEICCKSQTNDFEFIPQAFRKSGQSYIRK